MVLQKYSSVAEKDMNVSCNATIKMFLMLPGLDDLASSSVCQDETSILVVRSNIFSLYSCFDHYDALIALINQYDFRVYQLPVGCNKFRCIG